MNQIKVVTKGGELKNGDYGCNRKRAYIDKVVTRVKESEKRRLMLEEAASQKAIIDSLKKELIQQKKCNCTICRFERKEISVLKYAQELGELLFATVKK